MKTVLLFRHAKSDWGESSLADFDRPLADRGLKDAPRMGKVLLDCDSVPDKIIASPAKRAKQTAELAAKACGYYKSITWAPSFYGGDSEDLLNALKQLPDTVERAMLVGHNPTMEETVSALLLNSEANPDEEYAIRIPTAGLLCLELQIMEWAALEPGDAILRWYLIPRLVKALQ